jgi:peptide-O-fucosyltransferase
MNPLALISSLTFVFHLVLSQNHCDIKEIFVISNNFCEADEAPSQAGVDNESLSDPVYILYSVNPVEGFNLRRDVYLRMAIFVRHLRRVKGYENSHLILPVFHHLYHWKSQFRQSNMFWNHFFDLPSLKLFTSVLDMWEFFDVIHARTGQDHVEIGEVYKLQHFESMFENGVFVDKFEEAACTRHEYDNYHYMENYYNITEKTITCINFQGSAMLLKDILEEYKSENHKSGSPRIVLFAHAETALHEFFGDEEYWMARRSMRFNKNLQSIGDSYRADFLGSTDKKDFVQRPDLWTDEKVGWFRRLSVTLC